MTNSKFEKGISTKPDSQIWNDIKKGCPTALGHLYDAYIDILFSYGLSLTKDREHIQDCIHDLFVDIFKYREKLTRTDNVKAYLFKSLGRKIHKKKDQKVIPIQTKSLSIEALQKQTESSHEQNLIIAEYGTEQRLLLSKAFQHLTKIQKKGLFLRYEENKTYEEISKIMETSVPTARTTIYRALKVLREKTSPTAIIFIFHFFC